MERNREEIDNSGFRLVISDYNSPLNRPITSAEYFEMQQKRNNSINPRYQEVIIEENKIDDDEPIRFRGIPAIRQEEVN